MNHRTRYWIFGLICVAQLAAPVSLVVKHEQTRATGSLWKFQTAPVDPSDPFRGKYVRLSFAATRQAVPFAANQKHNPHERRMYAELAVDQNGYERLVRLHRKRPSAGDYLDVVVQARTDSGNPQEHGRTPAVYVQLPFDRYYLPEDKALKIERAYNQASREAQGSTYAEVRVRDGHAALVALVLNGQRVKP